MSSKPLIELSLRAFTEALAEQDSTPAGGSAAASVGAQGAALGAMVLGLSAKVLAGEERGYLEATQEELEELRECLLDLVQRDAEAYRSLVRAQKEGTDRGRIAAAAQAAWEAPMEVAELCVIALRRLSLCAHQVREHLRVDHDVALACLRTGIEAGVRVAEVNLSGLADAAREDEARAMLMDLRGAL